MTQALAINSIRLRLLVVFLAIAAAGCRTECIAGTGCGGPVTYAVTLDVAPDNLGAMVLAIGTSDSTTVAVSSGRSIPAQLNGSGTRHGIVLGAARGAIVATIRFNSAPAQPPTVTVLHVAASQAGGYLPIPVSAVQLRVAASSGGS